MTRFGTSWLPRLGFAAFAAALLLAPAGHGAGEFRYRGFMLPGGAVKVDDDRFRLLQNWDEMRRFYRANYPPARFPRRTLRNQAGLRAMHMPNPAQNGEWEGVNIYENGRGEVRIYVIGKGAPPEVPPAPPAKPDAGE
jgi:hypothetical protein